MEPINWLRNTSPADENSSPDEGADITKSDGGQGGPTCFLASTALAGMGLLRELVALDK